MQSDKTCPILEQYLAYLITIKGRSQNTILEYRMDLLQFFRYVTVQRGIPETSFQFADADCSIHLTDMYDFIAYHLETLHNSPGIWCRKIVSIRQFWKYLKTKAHIIDNNIAKGLKTPKLPKRIVRCMTLEESVRLLIEANSSSARDNCIITIFLNCALLLSELVALNVEQVGGDVLTVIGKGNKERKIHMTPAVKQALSKWLPVRCSMHVDINALFVSRNRQRHTTRSIQNVVKKHIIASGINPEGRLLISFGTRLQPLCIKYGHVDIRSLQQILGHESIATTDIYISMSMTTSFMQP